MLLREMMQHNSEYLECKAAWDRISCFQGTDTQHCNPFGNLLVRLPAGVSGDTLAADVCSFLEKSDRFLFNGMQHSVRFRFKNASVATRDAQLLQLSDLIEDAGGYRGRFRGVLLIDISVLLDEDYGILSDMISLLKAYVQDILFIFVCSSAEGTSIHRMEARLAAAFPIHTLVFSLHQNSDLAGWIETEIGRLGADVSREVCEQFLKQPQCQNVEDLDLLRDMAYRCVGYAVSGKRSCVDTTCILNAEKEAENRKKNAVRNGIGF